MRNGRYAFRFSGASAKVGRPHHIVGLGHMNIDGERITGHHSSTITELLEQDSKLQHTYFSLEGRYFPGPNGLWSATILFISMDRTPDGQPAQTLDATFDFVAMGAQDHFWIISTGARNVTENQDANEVVSGEAVWIGELPPPVPPQPPL